MCLVERLTEKDYDEALAVLNESFTKDGQPADFVKNLPIMWTRERNYMERHFGVREGGKLVAILGVYPLEVSIAGHTLLFATMGNIGTVPAARGKGYMKQLLDAGMRELDRLNVDVARLGGLRSRYNRFGFDHAGTQYRFRLTRRNAQEKASGQIYAFRRIEADDREAVAFARSCQQRSGIHAVRPTHTDFFMSMRAWDHWPYLALDEKGHPAGYLCVSQDGSGIAEIGVREDTEAFDVLASFLMQGEAESLSIAMMPADTFMTQKMIRCCESWSIGTPSMFRFVHWDRILDTLLALRCQKPCVPGTAVIAIEGYGALEMTVCPDGTSKVCRTDAPAQVTLSPMQAGQCLMGPFGPEAAPDQEWPAVLSAWLPLPMSWNGQDRV